MSVMRIDTDHGHIYSRVDRQVTGEPGVGIVNTQHHESGQDHTDSSVDDVEVRNHQWVGILQCKHEIPFKRTDRVLTHQDQDIPIEGWDRIVS